MKHRPHIQGAIMKPFYLSLSLFLGFILGCNEPVDSVPADTTPPPPPQGITSISLNNAIELQWLPSQAEDVKGYNIWVSNAYNGKYLFIGTTTATSFVDHDAVNGTTYYYAISAFDYEKNESLLSKDVIYDTPRPEGLGVVLFDTLTNVSLSGYDFSQYLVQRYNSQSSDFFFEPSYDRIKISAWNDSDIQDMGYTTSLDEISAAPTKGWAPSKSAEAILGHTYIVWTWDDHYAKVRLTGVTANRLTFDWAYQTAVGNVEVRISRAKSDHRMELQHGAGLLEK
jgi:hypothetical protein